MIKVRKATKVNHSSTDKHLLVNPESSNEYFTWDRNAITTALQNEAQMNKKTAEEIAEEVEKKVFASGVKSISTGLIREIVNNELFERGLHKKIQKQITYKTTKTDIRDLIFSKSDENSNITSNNPEALNFVLSEGILKQYSLSEIFSQKVADAHRNGAIYVHDLGAPTRVYCSSHSLEYIKKYGLRGLDTLDSTSAPAKHARTLTVHLNTFLSVIQAYYAGALGIGYVNILYAPYLEGMSDKEIYQEAQHLIFQTSQNAFSRGGQALFIDFNVHSGIPEYLKSVKAIGPGGKYTGKTYGDYEELSQKFIKAMLQVWRAGDAEGVLVPFPKLDFHVTAKTFSDPKEKEIYDLACKVASENGGTYFMFDRDEVTLSACCRLKTVINDRYMIEHPESMRFCGFQNVTINLPQCAYRSGKNEKKFLKEIKKMIDIAVQAHLEKKKYVKSLMNAPHLPLWQIGKIAEDGRPYVDLELATYIVGLIGLNEALIYMYDKELHEEGMLECGLKIISYMFFLIKEYGQTHDLKFSLEESPAESATRRLAKMDMRNFPDDCVVRGSIEEDNIYYTNSIHIRADADVDIVERIEKQSKFHAAIESGAIVHVFCGENKPSAQSIASLVKKTYEKTDCAQLTISPEFTVCNKCGKFVTGLIQKCPKCGVANMQARYVVDDEKLRPWE